MNRYLLTPAAQTDLHDIYDYTEKTWDADRAEVYLRRIQTAIETAAARPGVGRACDEIRPGYRKLAAAASHVIYYRLNDDGDIEVIRILHQRMDVDSHLS
ncbi:type II toxin-antitoxin system RelE/ParE family toxin [Nocardia sp. NPDC087230]|uniref:type II toxin-antitoxin system RelE/ParE family toxin n=1 Tax=Nocardia sp. NPDC087230 TaxID=3364331 RepID=UPI003826C45E